MGNSFERYQKAKKNYEVCKINLIFIMVLAIIALIFVCGTFAYSAIEGFKNTFLLSITGPAVGLLAFTTFILLALNCHKKLKLAKLEAEKEKALYVANLKESIVRRKKF